MHSHPFRNEIKGKVEKGKGKSKNMKIIEIDKLLLSKRIVLIIDTPATCE